MTAINVVILAAGLGRRLGLAEPKPLAPINGRVSIIEEQLRKLDIVFPGHQTTIVVGHLASRFDFLSSRASLVLNPDYATTNTAKSLLIGLQAAQPGGVLWMNGDVVFSENALSACSSLVAQDISFSVVNESQVADEEVGYTTDANGVITSIGKKVPRAIGEAFGINYVGSEDRSAIDGLLKKARKDDFFEAAMNLASQSRTVRFETVLVGASEAIEVDTKEDLAQAQERFGNPL